MSLSAHAPIDEFIRQLASRIGRSRYDFWFSNRVSLSIDEQCLKVICPNDHFKELISSRYKSELEAVAKEFLGRSATCQFFVGTSRPVSKIEPPQTSPDSAGNLVDSAHPAKSDHDHPAQTHNGTSSPLKNLDGFIISEDNHLALFSSRSFAQADSCVSLLVLVGPPSRGKSHLLEGIRNQLLSAGTGVAKQLGCEQFISRFIDSLRKGKTAAFRKNILDCDALLIDDLDKLEGKPTCQAEFLNIIELAKQRDVRVAVSLPMTPRQSKGLNPSLVERLQSGLVCPIGALDDAGKARLMSQFLTKLGVGLVCTHFFDQVSRHLPESPREIEGIAQKVWLLARLEARPIDMDLFHKAMDGLARLQEPRSIGSITAIVAGVLGTTAEAITGRSRSPIHEMGRLFVYYLARKLGTHSCSEIGAHFNGRKHSTIINGAGQVEKRLCFPGERGKWPAHWKSLLTRSEHLLNSSR